MLKILLPAFTLPAVAALRPFTTKMSAGAGKVYIVTGATSGIGRHTAERLTEVDNAHIIVHGRSPELLRQAVNDLKKRTDKVDGILGDFGSLSDVRKVAEEIKQKSEGSKGGIVLINNAGTFEPRRKVSQDGLELTFAVNVAAPFLLTALLLPLIKSRAESRIINISSISQGGASRVPWDDLQLEKGYSQHSSYSLSKLLMSMYSIELAQKVGSTELPVLYCDPGTVNTKMLLAGWGPCGIDVSVANDEFNLATQPQFAEANGKYFVGCRESRPNSVAQDAGQRKQLWYELERITGAKY